MIIKPRPRYTQFSQLTRKLRKCHLRKLYQRRRAIGWRPPVPPVQPRRLDDRSIDVLDQIFRGMYPPFGQWYRANHDENGRLLPSARMPGLW